MAGVTVGDRGGGVMETVIIGRGSSNLRLGGLFVAFLLVVAVEGCDVAAMVTGAAILVVLAVVITDKVGGFEVEGLTDARSCCSNFRTSALFVVD